LKEKFSNEFLANEDERLGDYELIFPNKELREPYEEFMKYVNEVH